MVVCGGAFRGNHGDAGGLRTLAMLAVLAWRSQRPLPGQQVVLALWALGVLAFAGSLYLMALAGLSVGIVTPIGGLLLMAGWLALGVTALLSRS